MLSLFDIAFYLLLVIALAQFFLRKGWFYNKVLERARKSNPGLDERRFRAWQIAIGLLLLAFLVLQDLKLLKLPL